MTKTNKRLLTIGLLIVAVAAAVFLYFSMQDKTPMVPLFTYKLKQYQLQQVEAYLKNHHYDYELREKEVYVHQDKFDEILVNMSSEGIPSP